MNLKIVDELTNFRTKYRRFILSTLLLFLFYFFYFVFTSFYSFACCIAVNGTFDGRVFKLIKIDDAECTNHSDNINCIFEDTFL